mgnify:FL=1
MVNKVVIVTGASSGIGMAAAEEFIKAGCRVVIAARRTEKLTELKNRLLQDNSDDRILPVSCDVSVESDCKALIEKTIEDRKSVV